MRACGHLWTTASTPQTTATSPRAPQTSAISHSQCQDMSTTAMIKLYEHRSTQRITRTQAHAQAQTHVQAHFGHSSLFSTRSADISNQSLFMHIHGVVKPVCVYFFFFFFLKYCVRVLVKTTLKHLHSCPSSISTHSISTCTSTILLALT